MFFQFFFLLLTQVYYSLASAFNILIIQQTKYLGSLDNKQLMIGGQIHNASKNSHVQMKVYTWTKDSYGLFDYQAKPQMLIIKEFELYKDCKVYIDQKTQTVKIITQTDAQKSTVLPESTLVGTLKLNKQKDYITYLFEAQNRKSECQQQNGQQKNQKPSLYTVARDFSSDSKNLGHIIKPGNVIRLGRSQYKVIQLRNNDRVQALSYQRGNSSFEVIQVQTAKQNQNYYKQNQQNPEKDSLPQCRICLMSEDKPEDPLIAPCLCKGSMKYIHTECLQKQISGRVVDETEYILNYNFERLTCTICDSPLTRVVSVNDKVFQMLSMTKPTQPYILLSSTKSMNQNLCLIKLFNEGSRIRIGRSHQCQIRIDDISVSRAHSQIRFASNNFYINDLKSKFGTLVKFQNNCKHTLNKSTSTKLQFGRTAFQFKVIDVQQTQSEAESDIE